MTAADILPTNLIIDALLRFEIWIGIPSGARREHLPKLGHDEGLGDVQIEVIVLIQTVNELPGRTEIIVVHILRRAACPRLPCAQDEVVLIVDLLIPLSKHTPLITVIFLTFFCKYCGQNPIDFMFTGQTKNQASLIAQLPFMLSVKPISNMLLFSIATFIRLYKIAVGSCLIFPPCIPIGFNRADIVINTAFPFLITIIRLSRIPNSRIFSVINKLADLQMTGRRHAYRREGVNIFVIAHGSFIMPVSDIEPRICLPGKP